MSMATHPVYLEIINFFASGTTRKPWLTSTPQRKRNSAYATCWSSPNKTA
jgi:hypothetical protein